MRERERERENMITKTCRKYERDEGVRDEAPHILKTDTKVATVEREGKNHTATGWKKTKK